MDADLRAIPGFSGYSVTIDGRICGTRPRKNGRWLKPAVHRDGYLIYRPMVNGKQIHLAAHRAVALTYIGPQPEGMEVCHNDGNPANNHVSNLRWDTHSENMKDSFRQGRKALAGSDHGRAKITGVQVREIRALLATETLLTHKMISDLYGIGPTQVFYIKTGRAWKECK